MPRLYVDTNKFIGFYRSGLEPLVIFEELTKYSDYLVTTLQTTKEFHRNRVSVLEHLIHQFRESTEVKMPCGTSILKDLPLHKELVALVKDYRDKAAKVVDFLKEVIQDEGKDQVANKFSALFAGAKVIKYEITDEIIQRAQKRKLLGNPPTSTDKHSIGDEVAWEALLQNLNDDLIIVTEDRTYLNNAFLLKEEFNAKTGKELLLITERFHVGIAALGQVPSKELVKEEEAFEEELRIRYDLSLESPHCHAYNEWIGSKCMVCGRVSHPLE